MTQHWVNVSCLPGGLVAGAGQYPFCPSQHFILPYLHAGGIVQSHALNQSWINVCDAVPR